MCRVSEGALNAIYMLATLSVLWIATNAGNGDAASNTLAALLLRIQSWSMTITATFFVLGSTIFSWLFLRGRLVPIPLALLGLFASLITTVGLPLQLVGLLSGRPIEMMWWPMLLFEVTLAFWLIVKGANLPFAASSTKEV